jgi:hypothetical protein
MQEWHNLMDLLQGMLLDVLQIDEMIRRLDKTKKYTTTSLYGFLTFGCMVSKEAKCI